MNIGLGPACIGTDHLQRNVCPEMCHHRSGVHRSPATLTLRGTSEPPAALLLGADAHPGGGAGTQSQEATASRRPRGAGTVARPHRLRSGGAAHVAPQARGSPPMSTAMIAF